MKQIEHGGVSLAYEERGAGEQTVVFSHSYLCDHRHYEAQVAALEGEYRVVAYDHRDHGESGKASSPYTIDDLTDDGIAIIERTGAGPCHWVGLSTGGFVGMRIALRRPELLRSLTLLDTAAQGEPWWKALKYQGMFAVLRLLGTRPLMGETMKLMFADSTLGDPTRAEELALWRGRMAANDPAALIRFGNAIFYRDDVRPRLGSLTLPTLVAVGAEDRALPYAFARNTADAVPGARFEVIPRAGHLSTIDAPDEVNRRLVPFIRGAS